MLYNVAIIQTLCIRHAFIQLKLHTNMSFIYQRTQYLRKYLKTVQDRHLA